MTFLKNLLLDARGKDIVFKVPPEDTLGRYKEKIEYWRTCVHVFGALTAVFAFVYWPVSIVTGLVALRKAHLIWTKEA